MRIGIAAIIVSLSSVLVLAQSEARVAVVDLAGDERGEVRRLLEALPRRLELVDANQTRAAVKGAGYAGSLNLRRDEARDLGASLGCDFYYLGRVQNLRRIGGSGDHYFEATAAIFLVETRSGRLILFDLATSKSATEPNALTGLIATVRSSTTKYVDAITAAAERRLAVAAPPTTAVEEDIEILDGEVSSHGLSAPVFFQRLKPAYTMEAALADVTATVEVSAVFGVDGRVLDGVEVERWAGYGLDESAIATVRALRFKPAARDGHPVAVRALVRYNFVRPPSAAEREAEAERLRRSLRQAGKP